MTLARDIMTSNPICCQENDPIFRAVEIMKREDTGVVPIVDSQEKPIGIVTDRDISLEVILNNLDPKSTSLSRIMHKDLVTCSPQDDLNRVIDQMKRRQVKRILVVDNNRISGIISEHDIATSTDQQKVGEMASGVFS